MVVMRCAVLATALSSMGFMFGAPGCRGSTRRMGVDDTERRVRAWDREADAGGRSFLLRGGVRSALPVWGLA